MIMLLEHMDFFLWEVNGGTALSTYDSESDSQGSEYNCLVAYITVEDTDTNAMERAVKTVLSKARQFNVSAIVLYPFCHSPVRLAEPEKAAEYLRKQ